MVLLNKKQLKINRRILRNNSTSAEATLWKMLKNSKVEDKKFRRQYSINDFIVDFCCPSEKIIIELDGNLHGEYFKIALDEERDKKLESIGYKVLRFENRIVFQDPDFIIDTIRFLINKKIQE